MALTLYHRRAAHTHENLQFRRVAGVLKDLFEQRGWKGLLIGNPENETFSRMRADAILLYDHGLILIDFKDYQGQIHLPPNRSEFEMTQWYHESERDRSRTVIKGGSFINPFRQLKAYRETMYDVISSHPVLQKKLDPSRTCILNIFSGPITLNHTAPPELPYYYIVDEANLANFLYDYSSSNTYSEEVAEILNTLFPAEIWEESPTSLPSEAEAAPVVKIEERVEEVINTFISETGSGILVLESMEAWQRDTWVRYILHNAPDNEIPDTFSWSHSARISRRIQQRSGMGADSLYNTIYGGKPKTLSKKEDVEEETDQEAEDMQEIVPIRSDETYDPACLVILQEAHLVTRSYHQSELLRFGSGHLLEDLLTFLELDSNQRKLICVGDPYTLSFGKADESALSINTLQRILTEQARDGGQAVKVYHFRQAPDASKGSGKAVLRSDLAGGLEKGLFNSLTYAWKDNELEEIDKPGIAAHLKAWFNEALDREPSRAVLMFTNEAVAKTNLWIKSHCLENGSKLSPGDLLMLNNNVNVPDETGFGQPTKLYNGMYLLVKEILETKNIPVGIKQLNRPVMLRYTSLRVLCLSTSKPAMVNVWLLNNYFDQEDLSKEEQIALRVFVTRKSRELLEQSPFNTSREFSQLQLDPDYNRAQKDEQELRAALARGEKVKTKLESKGIEKRKFERSYQKRYRQRIQREVIRSDPFINAVQASYGWAITVHKAAGATFEEIILNASQGETAGINNASYYRWLYTAMTCVQKKASVIHSREINPMMDCEFKDGTEVSILSMEKGKKKPKPKFFAERPIPDDISTKLNESFIDNLKWGIIALCEAINSQGYVLARTENKGLFLSKAHFIVPAQPVLSLQIAINNNKQGAISSIRIETLSGGNREQIQACLDGLWADQEEDWPGGFRGAFYQSWHAMATSDDYVLKLETSHKHHDFLSLQGKDGQLRFKATYNDEGFISYITVVEKSSQEISDYLKQLTIGGN